MTFLMHPLVTREDIPALDHGQQLQVVKALVALRENPTCPEGYRVDDLGPTHVRLDLTSWRALKLTGVSYDSALRIIFRVEGETCEVLAVARRQASLCYRLAQERLHPPVRPRRRMRTHSSADWRASLERPRTEHGHDHGRWAA